PHYLAAGTEWDGKAMYLFSAYKYVGSGSSSETIQYARVVPNYQVFYSDALWTKSSYAAPTYLSVPEVSGRFIPLMFGCDAASPTCNNAQGVYFVSYPLISDTNNGPRNPWS